jgi:hypothetical protein
MLFTILESNDDLFTLAFTTKKYTHNHIKKNAFRLINHNKAIKKTTGSHCFHHLLRLGYSFPGV